MLEELTQHHFLVPADITRGVLMLTLPNRLPEPFLPVAQIMIEGHVGLV